MESYENDDRVTPRTMLARHLHRLRENSELSLRELAEKVRFPHTYISRVERGKQLPSKSLATALDENFDTHGLFVELLGMAQDSVIAGYSRDFVSKEIGAIRIQVFTSSVIPGLLQTPDYTRELFREGLETDDLDELETHVTARVSRQRVFERDELPFYWAIMDEAALKRSTSSRAVMREQLEHLTQVAGLLSVRASTFKFFRSGRVCTP